MPTITSANLANAIVKLVAADALPALMSNLVMGNLVNRDYEPVLAHAGDTVNVPILRRWWPTTSPKAERFSRRIRIWATRRSC